MSRYVHLFVYGSLLSGARHEMGRRLRARARLLGPATMPGRLYDLGAYPGAVHDTSARERVQGELWRMLHPDRLLAILDVYEGCAPGQPQGAAFIRRQVAVTGPGGRIVSALSYLWTGVATQGRLVASGDWLLHCGSRFQRPVRSIRSSYP